MAGLRKAARQIGDAAPPLGSYVAISSEQLPGPATLTMLSWRLNMQSANMVKATWSVRSHYTRQDVGTVVVIKNINWQGGGRSSFSDAQRRALTLCSSILYKLIILLHKALILCAIHLLRTFIWSRILQTPIQVFLSSANLNLFNVLKALGSTWLCNFQ